MRRIWKFTLAIEDEQAIELPQGAQLLSTANQGGQLAIWAMCDPDAPKVKRRFSIRGTGHPAEGLDTSHFLGTLIFHNGGLVFHVFDRGEMS